MSTAQRASVREIERTPLSVLETRSLFGLRTAARRIERFERSRATRYFVNSGTDATLLPSEPLGLSVRPSPTGD